MKKEITAADIKLALSRKYSYESGWMIFEEIEHPTKWKSHAWIHDFTEEETITMADWYKMMSGEIDKQVVRRIDVYAVAMQTTKEATAIGIEIKVKRTDFKRELKSKKYLVWLPYCDKFYFACAVGVAKPEEIPEGCGLIEVNRYGRGYQRNIIVEAPRRSIDRPPWRLVSRLTRKIYNDMWQLNYKIGDLEMELRKQNKANQLD